MPVTNKPSPNSIASQIFMGSFVTGLFQNTQEGTKALVFVFVFVFVLVDEQAKLSGQITVDGNAVFPGKVE